MHMHVCVCVCLCVYVCVCNWALTKPVTAKMTYARLRAPFQRSGQGIGMFAYNMSHNISGRHDEGLIEQLRGSKERGYLLKSVLFCSEI